MDKIVKAVAVVLAASSVGSAIAIPPPVSGGPGQISGAAPMALGGYGEPLAAGPVDPAAVSALQTAISNAITGLPAGATEVDAEAAIIFAIDQANQPLGVVLAALDGINASMLSGAARSALNNVRATRGRVAQRGTGSIAGGPVLDAAFGPDLSVYGGSSDYSR